MSNVSRVSGPSPDFQSPQDPLQQRSIEFYNVLHQFKEQMQELSTGAPVGPEVLLQFSQSILALNIQVEKVKNLG